jgi:DNA-binding winged helix-turn-helix (wHTH) protein/predicted ATPase
MIRFEDFELAPERRMLFRKGRTVAIRDRALVVLQALVERAGEVVTKRELCRRAWPERDVDENNLQVEILGLRKILGRHAIVTAAGRGYQFTLPVVDSASGVGSDRALIGRDEDLASLLALLGPGALVTLTGEAGIGKTALAEAIASRARSHTQGGAHVVAVDTIVTTTPAGKTAQTVARDRLRSALADALGLKIARGDVGGAIASVLRGRPALLVLDGCDAALQPVAVLAAELREAAPAAAILVTSREILRLPAEHVYRLGPLSSSGDRSAATQLFRREFARATESRAAASAAGVSSNLADRDEDAIAAICTVLDGNPLAITIAAHRAARIGSEAVRAALAEGFAVLDENRAADPAADAAAGGRSLGVLLDRSLASLADLDRRIYCLAAALAQPFTLDDLVDATQVARIDAWDAMEALTRLVEKSIVATNGEDLPHYRISRLRLLRGR